MKPTLPPNETPSVSAWAVLLAFLRLGCTSFGGPIAHLGYFREEFVERRRWLDDREFAQIVAIAQTLPGPASSQVGFTVGLLKAGWRGGLAAWAGFTLPSAFLMALFAVGHSWWTSPRALAALHGLQLVAVAVVAQAVLALQKTLAPDRIRALIAVGGAAAVLLLPSKLGTPLAILFGALCGLALARYMGSPDLEGEALSSRAIQGWWTPAALCLFVLLLLVPAHLSRVTALFSAFYRSGALVFGGGHVVLPLLERAVVGPGWVDESSFLAGYGAAQAIPGPLFTFSAYLGMAQNQVKPSMLGAAIALVAIFLPGLLLMSAVLPHWTRLHRIGAARAALAGVNASVVGLLGAALYQPIWVSTIKKPVDVVIALLALVLLVRWRIAPWVVVLLTAALASLLAV